MHALRRATPLILAGFFALAICACKREPEVKDLAESGWTLAIEPPPPAAASLDRLPDLAAAGWTITPSSLSEVEQVFGSEDPDWIRFKSNFEPGDRVVRLIAPGRQWANAAGWDGYAIVRGDKVVADLAVLLS
ncbi:MAG: hypothetical protein QM795_11910 [Pseudoxanthomonas sp.]